MTFIPVYPRKAPMRWQRIHTAVVIAVIINAAMLVLLGWYAGAFAEDTIYEVNLVNVIKSDAEVKSEPPQKHLTLDPAKARRGPPRGEPAPAPAPGHKPQNVAAKAPPKLKVDAPQVTPDNQASEPDPSMVNNPPPPPDASLNGNPEGVAGGTGNQEGPGGTGTGGTGTGGNGPGGGGGGGGFASLVRDVRCLGCHQAESGNRDVEPDQIEKLFAATRWRGGGTMHLLTLGVTLNEQGYVKTAVVVLSTGNAEVDESAIMFLKLSKWKNHTEKEVYVEMPLEVYF